VQRDLKNSGFMRKMHGRKSKRQVNSLASQCELYHADATVSHQCQQGTKIFKITGHNIHFIFNVECQSSLQL